VADGSLLCSGVITGTFGAGQDDYWVLKLNSDALAAI